MQRNIDLTCYTPAKLANLKTKISGLVPQVVLELIDLLVGQTAIHGSVSDAVAFGGSVRLGVGEFINEVNLLNEVTSNTSGHLEEVVLNVILGEPKRNVLKNRRELRVGLKLGNLPLLELGVESLVIGPEKTNVGNLEQDHGQPLQTKPEGPTATL